MNVGCLHESWTGLIAARFDFEDIGFWFYVGLILLGVIGGLIKKSKGGPSEEKAPERRPRPARRAPSPQPSPTPPEPFETPSESLPELILLPPTPPPPPPPRRPEPAEDRVGDAARVERPRRGEPIRARAAQPPERARRTGRKATAARAPEPGPPAERAGELAASPWVKRPVAAAGIDDVRRLLTSRRGLASAFVVAEILAPPVALRGSAPPSAGVDAWRA